MVMDPLETEQAFKILQADFALKEVEVARQFNYCAPATPKAAIMAMEEAITSLMGVQQSLIFILDEATGTFTCLNDEKDAHAKPREITQITDHFIQDLMGQDAVLHAHLDLNGQLLGFVAVADKVGTTGFEVRDSWTLELIARYLSTQILIYQRLRDSKHTPYVQQAVLEMGHHLVGALDQEDVLAGITHKLTRLLQFEVGQYVALNPQTGEGQILYESHVKGSTQSSFSFKTSTKRRVVRDIAALVSLFASSSWGNRHLHIQSQSLGDHPLSELFGIQGAEGALVVPVFDTVDESLCGAFILFEKEADRHLPKASVEIATETAILVSKALSRTLVLEKALALATRDELTGLMNRRGFYERFELELERSRRNRQPMALAMLDVDHFKKLNDTHGHLTGDLVLKTLADILQQNIRKNDVLCRFGGEEFVLLLPETNQEDAYELMDRIRQRIAEQTLIGCEGQALSITISAGLIDFIPEKTTGASEKTSFESVMSKVLAAADEQLYLAKSQGRNVVCV